MCLVASFVQSPGLVSPDTKLDLTADPVGFLARAAHLWSSTAPLGQVQNQAYGYFFPHGAFFAAGDLLGLPGWVTQRLWWALLLFAGVLGVVRLAEALGVGRTGARILAGAAYAASPRVLLSLGAISSETLPIMLAPWVLLPLVVATSRPGDVRTGGLTRGGRLDPGRAPPTPRQLAARAVVAVALMGAVNAVATAAACLPAALWWLCHARSGRALWWRTSAWLAGLGTLACLWWAVPLWLLGRVSPPFLDYIESSQTTTRWTGVAEALRGASAWTPHLAPENPVLLSQPAAILASGIVAALGLAGLAARGMPARGPLVVILLTGVVLLCLGYDGPLGSPIAEQVRTFLDAAGAPLRNVHKLEPALRIPLVLGLAHLLAAAQIPGNVRARRGLRNHRPAHWFAHPESRSVDSASSISAHPVDSASSISAHPVDSASSISPRPGALAALAGVALVVASSTVWTGSVAAPGAYRELPAHWRDAAAWLTAHSTLPTSPDTPMRTLVVPGAPFAFQLWGRTRDEPLQPLAEAPWVSRDSIPLVPPAAIRALDVVQRALADGRAEPWLRATLTAQGIGFVALRADLDPSVARSSPPLLARQALVGAGLRRVAEFGPAVGPDRIDGIVTDDGLHPDLTAIEIYAVDDAVFPGTGPVVMPVDALPRIAGGPEAVTPGPALLASDAARAGLPPTPVTVTDTPTDREVDVGRVDHNASALRTADAGRRTQGRLPDYDTPDVPRTSARWLLAGRPGEVTVSASSSASDATQLGRVAPGSSPAAAFDGDPATSWLSGGLTSAVDQWLRLDFTRPQRNLAVTVTVGRGLGSPTTRILVRTPAGTTSAQVRTGEPTVVYAPRGEAAWIEVRSVGTENGSAGTQFAVAELALAVDGTPTPVGRDVLVPAPPADAPVAGWRLRTELPGRGTCVEGPAQTQCAASLGIAPEERLARTLTVPAATAVTASLTVHARPGPTLSRLLATPGVLTASGAADVADPRGAAGAAVDGDPRTVWTPRPGSRDPAVLRIRLPRPERVTALRITPPATAYPARPTLIAVDLGDGRQVREVPADGVVRLTGATTSQVTAVILDSVDTLDVNSLGFGEPAPAGFAEAIPLGPGDVPVAPTPDPNRIVDVGCADGPVLTTSGLTAAGRTVAFRLRASAADLAAGRAVTATPCSAEPVALPAGEVALTTAGGDGFAVTGAELTTVGTRAPAATPAPATTAAPAPAPVPAPAAAPIEWTPAQRVVDVPASGVARVLVVPEATNPGWHASLDGVELTPVTVSGWQQGWVLPPGASGRVVMTFPLDRPYRWALFGGLALLPIVVLAAVLPGRRRGRGIALTARPESPDRPRSSRHGGRGLAAVGVVAACGLVGGPAGAALGMIGAVCGMRGAPYRRPDIFALVAGGAAAASAFALARGPWLSEAGYAGASWPAQLAALVALAAVGGAAVSGTSPAPRRRIGRPTASSRQLLSQRPV